MIIQEHKAKVLTASKRAFSQGLFAGTSGNLSCCLREDNIVIITPSSIRYEEMQIEDIVVIDLEGNIIEGNHNPSSEWPMHCAIYKQREDVSSVVHTHSPYATSFSVINKIIPAILIEMIPFLGGDIQNARFALPGSAEIATEALKILKNRGGCLLENHGVLTIGDKIEQAFIRAEYIEDAARIYHHALQAGTPNVISDEIIAQI